MSPAPSLRHQVSMMRILEILDRYKQHGIAIPSPVDVVLDDSNVFQPDIVCASNERNEIIKDEIVGVPHLVIKVLSRSNAYNDLTRKKDVCEESRVGEFWVVDRKRKRTWNSVKA